MVLITECLVVFVGFFLLQLASSGPKYQTGDTGSHLSSLLEHVVAAMEKFIARKRKKKPSTDDTAPLEVVLEHPVLVSTLALLLHHNPQLVSTRYVRTVRGEAAVID